MEPINETSQSVDVAEHDIFGEAVSDSEEDDEETQINVIDLDESSRLSVDSRVSDSNSMQVKYSEQLSAVPSTSSDPLVTEFSKDMFMSEETIEDIKPDIEDVNISKVESFNHYDTSGNSLESQNAMVNKDAIQARGSQLQAEILQLQEQRRQQESAIDKIENVKLRERFQEIIDNLLAQEVQKLQELNELVGQDAS